VKNKTYLKPKLCVVAFSDKDVIATSDNLGKCPDDWGKLNATVTNNNSSDLGTV